jgi:hypothetical protein
VVAKDAAQLRAKYPSRQNIVGDLRGNLPNGHGRIVLVDAAHNPADEVHYFDGGHWDERADGFGPSLELQDPHADNAQGEAWSASDEASKSSWRTYTYRGVAQSTISGEPTLWHEFAFGILDGAGGSAGGIRDRDPDGGGRCQRSFDGGRAIVAAGQSPTQQILNIDGNCAARRRRWSDGVQGNRSKPRCRSRPDQEHAVRISFR